MIMKKLKFATIGTSWICEEFIDTAKTDDRLILEAVYSRSEDKAIKYMNKHSANRYFTDINKMAADPNIDCVYIASPNSFHVPQSIVFLKNKKHVLCEKPLGSNYNEIKSAFDIAKDNNVLLMEAYKSMMMPNLLYAKELLKELGEIRSVFATFSKYSSRYDAHKRGENVNTFKSEFSNGAILDLGIYCLYPILHMFGEPKDVKSFSVKVPGGVDGVGSTIFNYDTFLATINYSKVSNSFLPCEICGENATMIIDKFNIPEKIDLIYRDGSKKHFEIPQRNDSMCYEIKEFIDVVLGEKEKPSINTPEITLLCASICDKIRKMGDIVFPADIL